MAAFIIAVAAAEPVVRLAELLLAPFGWMVMDHDGNDVPEADLLILDLDTPDGLGLERLDTLRSAGFDRPILVLTAFDAAEAIRARQLATLGAEAIPAPLEPLTLIDRVRGALATASPRRATAAQPKVAAASGTAVSGSAVSSTAASATSKPIPPVGKAP
jgi:DNA-binding response OmpR family regulator